ncbi:MAG: type III-A CRISPR-associated protein Cas10/Csm1 [Saprospiraceae bacterium]
MDNTREKIVLAALLHDIGKFWQRGDDFLSKSPYIENPNQDWGWLVPNNPKTGYPTRQHAIWTWQFFSRFKNHFINLRFQYDRSKTDLQSISAKHHQPDCLEAAIIQMADHWSSAIDRRKIEYNEEENLDSVKNLPQHWTGYAYKKIPLHSIFNDLKVKDKEDKLKLANKPFVFKINPLSIQEEDIFPDLLDDTLFKVRNEKGLESDYRKLWEQFEQEFALLPTGSFDGFFVSLLALLKKYTWCIPSSTMDMPNVSLFEHLKTTAAFAACLYDFWVTNEQAFEFEGASLKLKPNIDPVLMCCLDLSGIQKFIYDITSRKASQSLKGRSFYLQLLLDNLLSLILTHEKIQQTQANIIYSSGGTAYFLLPNTPNVEKGLVEAYQMIQQFAWDEHKGKIFPALSWLSFRYEFHATDGSIKSNQAADLRTLGDLWQKVSELAGIQKRKKFKSLLTQTFDDFFSEKGRTAQQAQTTATCAVTGEPILGKAENIGRDDTEENRTLVLPSVKYQTDLGRNLKDCQYLIQWMGKGDKLFDSINYCSRITSDINDTNNRKLVSEPSAIFSQFNDTDFLVNHTADHAAYTFHFYGGNKQPEMIDEERGENRVKTLEELCYTDPVKKEFSKLGILRMDVDNLGKIFRDGFDEKNKSFSAYATLSFLLDLFFSGYINSIWEGKEKFKSHVSILYSGGDDLFALGRWDVLLNFAAKVQKSFSAFTGRTDISLSGGMVIVDRKFPIYKAAALAGEAEDKAKAYESSKWGDKNAICFFDETISWNREFEFVKDTKKKFFRFIKDEQLNRSLLHQLQRYKSLKDFGEHRQKKEGKAKDFSYKWHSAYYLKRFADRHQNRPEGVKTLLQELQERILHEREFDSADRYLDLVALAARWAEYELKIIESAKPKTEQPSN